MHGLDVEELHWQVLAERWAEKADENIQTWGKQDLDTLLLAAQEELGELTQAVLEARAEDGDPDRIADELDDLAALMFQIRLTIAWENRDVETDAESGREQ